VLKAPHWQAQAWFPALQELVVEVTQVMEPAVLTGSLGNTHPVISQWKVSGESTLQRAYLSRLVAGWSRDTNTVYESGWRHWACWCDSKHVDPFSSGIQPFLDFMEVYVEGLQHRTINRIQSAVSMTHNPIENVPIASSGEEADKR